MNDVYITLTGNVATEPRQHQFSDGTRVTSMRVATTGRYFDRRAGEWRSAGTTFFTVRCFRSLADNVAQSIRLGHPVVVHGRLRIRHYQRGDEPRMVAEIEAGSVGHDLRWGIGSYARPHHRGLPAPGETPWQPSPTDHSPTPTTPPPAAGHDETADTPWPDAALPAAPPLGATSPEDTPSPGPDAAEQPFTMPGDAAVQDDEVPWPEGAEPAMAMQAA
ncbi:single-strand DNA-binding protein [Sinosporangium album]|uniref:Single-stranded DNA-binding protein n=1 Tax=Sinosporangium album TaxID=504805 RepID=A0A1G7T833_9ACTN|nr:single-stranded DNA-binding protein [Sinosporangium album]SDG30760.1 single-strand DNA-binding protein [Sinosporangium album]